MASLRQCAKRLVKEDTVVFEKVNKADKSCARVTDARVKCVEQLLAQVRSGIARHLGCEAHDVEPQICTQFLLFFGNFFCGRCGETAELRAQLHRHPATASCCHGGAAWDAVENNWDPGPSEEDGGVATQEAAEKQMRQFLEDREVRVVVKLAAVMTAAN